MDMSVYIIHTVNVAQYLAKRSVVPGEYYTGTTDN